MARLDQASAQLFRELLFQVVGLVENQHRRVRQHLAEGGFAQHAVGQQESMVHDDEVGLGHFRPQPGEVAVLVARALAARAALGPGVDLVPQG
ncbi:MAG: hypothetical protein IPN91_14245 [Holophagaceae bacterium]|uniref:Uncharacterized protein n=1 Tax=Candidatus Geothrix odensensis TaxID=2954440 RepID=A0A936F430_9BACT|nr:hypothetical protein [Candidatus Geothrix odensensis]